MFKFVVLLCCLSAAFAGVVLPFTTPNSTVGERVAKWDPRVDKMFPYELGYGAYFQGDIMLRPDEVARNGIPHNQNKRWTNAVVPYVITGRFSSTELARINQAIKHYHDNTCVRFVQRTNQNLYIKIQNSAAGCWSYVGMSTNNAYNVVNLQTPGCVSNVGTPVHELMHAVGFNHEHVRPDRDTYVYINRTALAPEYNNDQWFNSAFAKTSPSNSETYGLAYNYGSVMHYSKWGAAADYRYPVMNNLKPWNGDFGQTNGFHAQDIKMIKNMYCGGK